jgi:hypothetical protein
VADPIVAVDLNVAADPNVAADLSAAVDHCVAALSVILAVQISALIAAAVQLGAPPLAILSVQKLAHAAVRILVLTVVQPFAVAHSVAAESRSRHGFFRAYPFLPASLA